MNNENVRGNKQGPRHRCFTVLAAVAFLSTGLVEFCFAQVPWPVNITSLNCAPSAGASNMVIYGHGGLVSCQLSAQELCER